MEECDHSSIVVKSDQDVLLRLYTRTQTSLPLSKCSTDDLVVKAGPLLHESFNEVVDVTDSRAVDALLQLVHRFVIGAVGGHCKGDSFTKFHKSASEQSYGSGKQSMLTSESTSWNLSKKARFWKR